MSKKKVGTRLMDVYAAADGIKDKIPPCYGMMPPQTGPDLKCYTCGVHNSCKHDTDAHKGGKLECFGNGRVSGNIVSHETCISCGVRPACISQASMYAPEPGKAYFHSAATTKLDETQKDAEVKDSGVREVMPTGSQRDTRVGKGRFDLLSMYALRPIALVAKQGASKYLAHNWRLGQPVSRYIDSAMRHLACHLAGLRDELHLAQAAWNCMSAMETIKRCAIGTLPKELDDLGGNAWEMGFDQFYDK